MLFSVVIPTYNRASLLRETLESVFAQRFTDYEVLVVDDGSTDQTEQVLQNYAGRVRVFRQQNRGAGAARNVGISQAIGRYIAFLDSDDVWFQWTLTTYASAVQKYNNPSFVAGKPFVFTGQPQSSRAVSDGLVAEVFPDYYSSSDAWRWFGASSFVIQKSRLEAVGGFHDGWGAEDADLTMMLGVERGFVHITAPHTFGYREQNESLKVMPTYTLSGSRLMLEKERNAQYPGGSARARERRRILSRQIRPVTFDCLRNGLHSEAWELYGATFGWHCTLGHWKYLLGFPFRAALAKGKPAA